MQLVALIPDGPAIDDSEMSAVSSAIQIQLQRDFVPWGVSAGCTWYRRPEDMPVGVWPVFIKEDAEGVAGFHARPMADSEPPRPPFAIVRYAEQIAWSVAASHEILEMLVDPRGDAMARGPDPADPQKSVEFLMEICDPCQGDHLAYQVDHGHCAMVSDFCLPSFYRKGGAGAPFTHRRSVSEAFSTAFGGSISYRDAGSQWWQLRGGRIVRADNARVLGDTSSPAWNFRGRMDRQSGTYAGPPGAGTTAVSAQKYAFIRKLARRSQKQVARELRKELERLDDVAKSTRPPPQRKVAEAEKEHSFDGRSGVAQAITAAPQSRL